MKPSIVIAAVALLAGSCSGSSTATEDLNQAGISPTSPTPLFTPSSYPTPRPTPTTTPTQAPSPATLSSSGPWRAGEDEYGLYVADADGSAQARVHKNRPGGEALTFALSPDGGRLAFAVGPVDDSSSETDFSLYLVTLPDISPQIVTSLFAQDQLDYITTTYPPDGSDWYSSAPGSAPYMRAQVHEAIFDHRSIAWSPDGRYLAFVGAIEGPTSDVYAYDTQTSDLQRLSSGPTQATDLFWSPDGQRIAHQAIDHFNLDSSGTDTIAALWVVDRQGGATKLLDGPVVPIGWLSPRLLFATNSVFGLGNFNLFLFDATSSRYTCLWPDSIDFLDQGSRYRILVPPPTELGTVDPLFLQDCGPSVSPPFGLDPHDYPDVPSVIFAPAREKELILTVEDGFVSIPPP